MTIASILAVALVGVQPELPTITIDRDNVVIDRSCRVVVPKGVYIEDTDGNGVVHVTASNITIEGIDRQGELIQVALGTPWETIGGIGWRLDNVQNVTLINIHSHRFKVGILATNCDGLTLKNCDVAGGYAMRLGSTPEGEDSADWLWPHENDEHQWRERYGAGICVENSVDVTIDGAYARRRQNGIILDRVTDSRIYDCDMSFLSGWGLAMWRSSGNTVSRNAFDFCIRGYSHGVYNRGQDSAGILMFEQCSNNVIAENSCTHSGDGIFAFAGREALGDGGDESGVAGVAPASKHTRLGNNDNLFIKNDLSHAAAHGLELTFSFGNRVFENIFESNAICGIWGGYSQDTLIADNRFTGNGHAGYGLERGGINIEHGAQNTIRNNFFRENAAGVHLWSDEDAGIRASPWAKANYKGAIDTLITENRFHRDELAIHLRDAANTTILANEFEGVGERIRSEGDAPVIRTGILSSSAAPEYEGLGEKKAVGDRDDIRGGAFIVMGEYFPWDYWKPMVRLRSGKGGTHVYEVFGVGDEPFGHTIEGFEDGAVLEFGAQRPIKGSPQNRPTIVTIKAKPGVHAYTLNLFIGDAEPIKIDGTMIAVEWAVQTFNWTVDPREDLEGWRGEASGAVAQNVGELDLRFAMGGPSDVGLEQEDQVGSDHFGTIARTRVRLPAGNWRFTTVSDDGVRVLVDGEAIIENWTWHGPTRDSGILSLAEPREVEIVVEHFELDGFAQLSLLIEAG